MGFYDKKRLFSFVYLIVFLAITDLGAAVLIPAGAIWRYNDKGIDLGKEWTAPDYDDSDWSEGPAQLGYGDNDEATVIARGPEGGNRYTTYYFRYSFLLGNPGLFKILRLRVLRDDGCVVYLNGSEVARSNMPEGEITYNTLASSNVAGAGEDAWHEFAVDASLLVSGKNVVAAEVHQHSLTSSDLSFDLSLDDINPPPTVPEVTLLSPVDDSKLPPGEVTFQCKAKDIMGLQSVSLYLGIAGEVVTLSGPGETEDAMIREDQPDTANGTRTSLSVDGQGPHAHVLIKFPRIFVDEGGKVPRGASITEATLQLHITDPGSDMKLYRLLEDWVEEEVTWTSRSGTEDWNAPGAEGELDHAPEEITIPGQTGDVLVDLTQVVQAWSDGEPNYGVVLIETGTNGCDFSSSESNNPPVLKIRYGGSWEAVETKDVSGNEELVSFSVNLAEPGEYRWNCLVKNTAGEEAFAGSDFYFEITGTSQAQFIRGDINQDGRVNLADALRLLGELFGGVASSTCPDAGDANDDGRLNIADAMRILGFLFGGQGELPPPGSSCGPDPTEDSLTSCVHQACP